MPFTDLFVLNANSEFGYGEWGLTAIQVQCIYALSAIVIHVVNYNVTARLEHATRCFTRIIGKNAIYVYAVFLILSALLRDRVIQHAVDIDPYKNEFPIADVQHAQYVGGAIFVYGVLLNLWTLKALGIKGMYNGDSFGHLMDAPVVDGPFRFFNDPQYVGTTCAALGFAIMGQSYVGVCLTAWMGIVFEISTKFFETPHMIRIYSERDQRRRRKNKNKNKKKANKVE